MSWENKCCLTLEENVPFLILNKDTHIIALETYLFIKFEWVNQSVDLKLDVNHLQSWT